MYKKLAIFSTVIALFISLQWNLVSAKCEPFYLQSCLSTAPYVCTEPTGKKVCCSESTTECQSLNPPDDNAGEPVPSQGKSDGAPCSDDAECRSKWCSAAEFSNIKICTVQPGQGDDTVDGKFLYDVDPLKEAGLVKMIAFQTPAGIVGALIPYLFTFAGLILFVMIVWGGFEMLTGAAEAKAQEAGKQRITAAVIGFILLFVSYWIAQIVQYMFGLNVL